jgi:hypothetical protein
LSTKVDEMKIPTAFDEPFEEGGVLEQLRHVHTARRQLERQEAVLVRRARNEGIVWEQIASCLGVSKQAVHKKHVGRFNRVS